MDIRYITDEQGHRVAVQIPIDAWEALRVRNLEYAEDVLPEEIAEAEAAWADIQANPNKAESLEQMREELLGRKSG